MGLPPERTRKMAFRRQAEPGRQDALRRARRLAQRYLRFGVRSTAELRAYLTTRQLAEPLIDALLAKYVRDGVLDDRACAKLLATCLADQGYAWGAVREQLLAKGLDAELVDQTLEPLKACLDDAARARALVQTRLRGASRTDTRVRARVARLLSQRGFDSDLIDRVLADTFTAFSE